MFSFASPTFLLKKKSRQKKIKIGRKNPLLAFFVFFSSPVGVNDLGDPKKPTKQTDRRGRRSLQGFSNNPLDCFLWFLFFSRRGRRLRRPVGDHWSPASPRLPCVRGKGAKNVFLLSHGLSRRRLGNPPCRREGFCPCKEENHGENRFF